MEEVEDTPWARTALHQRISGWVLVMGKLNQMRQKGRQVLLLTQLIIKGCLHKVKG